MKIELLDDKKFDYNKYSLKRIKEQAILKERLLEGEAVTLGEIAKKEAKEIATAVSKKVAKEVYNEVYKTLMRNAYFSIENLWPLSNNKW